MKSKKTLEKLNQTNNQKRSVVVSGHQTSVSLEQIFWDLLIVLAKEKNLSINQLITKIDRNRNGGLSSAIRVFIVVELLREQQISKEPLKSGPN
ncbi:MAG: ribbon-helix-helix domain-containing protein [Alphaproteobacteria bacterium]|nr:ribbon-helix-helix domain-containing protein [Alphaproteobacteria bacterium]|tara:strand:- start:361 stop:642 length:282 start_codon:yes stop_codon:yes gene_type:complete